MKIENYSFGKITIDGQEFTYDIEIHSWDGKILKWWRKESHLFDKEDIERVVKEEPEIIVFGTGQSGMAKLSQRAKEFLKEKNIEIVEEPTEKAIEIFNEYSTKNKKVAGLFHLTC